MYNIGTFWVEDQTRKLWRFGSVMLLIAWLEIPGYYLAEQGPDWRYFIPGLWWKLERAGGCGASFFQPRKRNFSEVHFRIVCVRTSLKMHGVLQPSANPNGYVLFCWSSVTGVCTCSCAHKRTSWREQKQLRHNERQRWKSRAAGAGNLILRESLKSSSP